MLVDNVDDLLPRKGEGQVPALVQQLRTGSFLLSDQAKVFSNVGQYSLIGGAIYRRTGPIAKAALYEGNTSSVRIYVYLLRAVILIAFVCFVFIQTIGSSICSYQLRPLHFDGPNPASSDFAMLLMKRAQAGESSSCVLVMDMFNSRQPNVTWDQWEGGHTKVSCTYRSE